MARFVLAASMVIVIVSFFMTGALAADADPINDFCIADLNSTLFFNGLACKKPSAVVASDFVFTGLRKAGNTSNPQKINTTRVFANINFPGLNTQGLGIVRVNYAKGGLVAPHEHPRASEVFFVMEGNISVGFVDTNGAFWPQLLQKGDVFVFPRAMVHFALNSGHGDAISYSVLNSQNPGVESIPSTLFGSHPAISDEVLAMSFGISIDKIKDIMKNFKPAE